MIMKRLKVISMVMLLCVGVHAQQRGTYMACTGNHVNVRTGPGKNYAVMGGAYKFQLNKGDGTWEDYVGWDGELPFCSIKYLGKKRNGFLYVEILGEGRDWGNCWVSAQYLKPVCTACHGTAKRYDDFLADHPRLLWKCKRCNGRGY